MIGANGSVSNTAITGVITGSQLASPLSLTGNVSLTGNLNFNSTGTSGVRLPTANTLAFYTAGTEDMRIDATGNVGIGATSLSDKLTIAHADEKGITFKATGTDGTTAAQLFFEDTNGGTGGVLRFDHDVNSFTFATAGTTERMRIDSSGRLNLNTSTNIDTSKLAILQTNDDNAISVKANSAATVMALQCINSSGTRVGYIQYTTSATTFSTSSDYRLKENIAPMTGALAKVVQLKPVTYKWKINGADGQGFIAHELAEVVPDCVTGAKDATEVVDIKDEEGNIISQETKPVYQGIDTSFLVATLTAAIQEQQATITALTARIVALENR
jgi:hypothetical protein